MYEENRLVASLIYTSQTSVTNDVKLKMSLGKAIYKFGVYLYLT